MGGWLKVTRHTKRNIQKAVNVDWEKAGGYQFVYGHFLL